MYITKFSAKLFGVKGSVYRVHAANGDVMSVHATLEEAQKAIG